VTVRTNDGRVPYANRFWYTASLVPILAGLVVIAALVKTSGARRLHASRWHRSPRSRRSD
jgi:hypothetical protein